MCKLLTVTKTFPFLLVESMASFELCSETECRIVIRLKHCLIVDVHSEPAFWSCIADVERQSMMCSSYRNE